MSSLWEISWCLHKEQLQYNKDQLQHSWCLIIHKDQLQHTWNRPPVLSVVSTSFGSVASFLGTLLKNILHLKMIYQKNTCCISVCHHPQTFNWILYSTKAAPAAWKQDISTTMQHLLLESEPITPPKTWCSFPICFFLLTGSVPQSMDRLRWTAFTQVNSIARHHHNKGVIEPSNLFKKIYHYFYFCI